MTARQPGSYRTIDLARAAQVHPNTVRFYERIGLLAPVPRSGNGYRSYSERHLVQLLACRHIYRHGWLGRELRRASLRILQALQRWDLPAARQLTAGYLQLLEADLRYALETAQLLKRWTARRHGRSAGPGLNRREAALALGITAESLRNWERSGLLGVPRQGPNRARVYGRYELERLRIIKLLRQAGYSPAAIHASLASYDAGAHCGVIAALNSPEPNEDAAWTVVGDRLVAGLRAAVDGARQLLELIEDSQKRDL